MLCRCCRGWLCVAPLRLPDGRGLRRAHPGTRRNHAESHTMCERVEGTHCALTSLSISAIETVVQEMPGVWTCGGLRTTYCALERVAVRTTSSFAELEPGTWTSISTGHFTNALVLSKSEQYEYVLRAHEPVCAVWDHSIDADWNITQLCRWRTVPSGVTLDDVIAESPNFYCQRMQPNAI